MARTYVWAKMQYYPDAMRAPKFEKRGITHVQSIAGTFLYISRVTNPTMLFALNEIGAKQDSPTTYTVKKTKILMDYTTMQRDTITGFHASNRCLHIDSDTAYLIQPKAHSCAAGRYYLSNNPPPPHIRPTTTPNRPILTKCQTIRTVMASATEAEKGAIFLNGHKAVPIRTGLIKMGHPQLTTPI